MTSLSQSTLLAVLPQWTWILSLIFIGCCSNAYYLEQATRIQPACGTLMTFLHFLFTTLQVLPTQLTFQKHTRAEDDTPVSTFIPRLRRPQVPLTRWSVQVALYFATSILNNSAFSFHVPVPVHIIFRSGGLVVSMILGYLLKGRKYSLVQIFSVLLVTGGVVASTLATTPDVDTSSQSDAQMSSTMQYFCGIGMLILALLLSSAMGLYQEQTYAQYGSKHWQEGLFYNHFLSLPLFALRFHTLRKEWLLAQQGRRMWVGWGSPDVSDNWAAWKLGLQSKRKGEEIAPILQALSSSSSVWDLRKLAGSWAAKLPFHSRSLGFVVPALFPALGLNVLTQLLCINGVNRLTAICSSLTVTLVLVVRKAISLAISVLIIAPAQGEEVKGKLVLGIGASAVLLGTVGYGYGTKQQADKEKKEPQHTHVTASKGATTSLLSNQTNAVRRKSTRRR